MNQRRREIEKLRREIPQDNIALTAEDLERWQDLPTFIESEYYIPSDETPERQRLIVLEPHQRAILRHAFTKGKDGRFPYTTIAYSTLKKSGKTELASGINLWVGLTWDANLELFCCANDYEQAQGRVFAGTVRALQMNPRLAPVCKTTQNRITFPNGTTLAALASDYAGAAGAQRLALSTWDELWAYTTESSRRLYDELTPIPTLKNSLRFITTYAGFEGESELLWELYERVVRKGEKVPPEELEGLDLPVFRDGSTLVYWDSLETAGEACRRMPWQQGADGDRYYEEQARELRPNAYRRLHWNLWTSNEENFLDPDQWDACVDPDHRPILPDKSVVLDVGVDAAIKHDQASVVAVTYDAEERRVVLARHRTFQPTPEDPLDLEETLEAFLQELARGYTLRSVYYDPYQFHRSATTLKKEGLPMIEWAQSSPNLTAMGQNLYELVQYQNMRLYSDTAMRQAATQAVALETPRGWRIAKEKSVHKIDVLIALAHASLACVGCLEEPLFDAQRLVELREKASESIKILRFASSAAAEMQALEEEIGPVHIYVDPVTNVSMRYALGVAVAGGVGCACVLDGDERAVVAAMHEAMPIDAFAEQVQGLSRHYSAQVVPLVNAGGQAVLERLQVLHGVRLYTRGKTADRAIRSGRRLEHRYGYLLNEATREAFYGELAIWIRSEDGLSAPTAFYDEALRFVRADGRLPVEITPAHLRVAALAAAVQGCKVELYDEKLPHLDLSQHRLARRRLPEPVFSEAILDLSQEGVQQLIRKLHEGQPIQCMEQDYLQVIRPGLKTFAERMANMLDFTRMQIAEEEMQRLDCVFGLKYRGLV